MTAELAKCRSCGAPIRWGAVAKTGANMPLDAEPHAQGNVRIAADGFTLEVLAQADAIVCRDDLYRSHFATCPNAARHRRGPGKR